MDLTSAYPHIQAGRLIALGLADSKRFPVTPEIPTIAEGGVPGFGRASGFIGLFAPAGTPAPVVKKLSREVAAILATPGAQTTARALTSATAYEDDEVFARFLTAGFREVEAGAVVAEFVELAAVIPGRAEGASPKSIFTGGGYRFRARRYAPRSATADLGTR